jgi:hypothetical protein
VSETIKAWKVRDDFTVQPVSLTKGREPDSYNNVQWWHTPRGAMVVIDFEHSDFFSDEKRALTIALRRAAALRIAAEELLRARLHKEHAAHVALAELEKRS